MFDKLTDIPFRCFSVQNAGSTPGQHQAAGGVQQGVAQDDPHTRLRRLAHLPRGSRRLRPHVAAGTPTRTHTPAGRACSSP